MDVSSLRRRISMLGRIEVGRRAAPRPAGEGRQAAALRGAPPTDPRDPAPSDPREIAPKDPRGDGDPPRDPSPSDPEPSERLSGRSDTMSVDAAAARPCAPHLFPINTSYR